jgi:hypothetical protein
MKMFHKIVGCSTAVAAVLAINSSTTQAQSLVNAGFETSPAGFTANPVTVAGVNQGWATFGGDAGAIAAQTDMSSSSYSPLSGSGALLETVQPGNNWGPAGAYQIITGITPGQSYKYNIWALTDTANDPFSATGGLLIQPSTQGVWTEYSVTATAPAGFTDAIVYTMFQDNATATSTENLYFDQASLVPAPEPSTLALAGLGGAGFLSLIRRRKS